MFHLITHVVLSPPRTVKTDILLHCYGKHKGLVISRYGSSTSQGSSSERAVKGVEIPPVHLLHLETFVGFKSQSSDFAGEIHPLFFRQVAMQLG